MKVLIEKFDHEGRGIAKVNDKVTFINNVIPGEEVEIKITKEHKKYNEAVVTKYITTSESRVEPECPYYGICGGCDIMHMDYSTQIEFKKEKISNILSKYANVFIDIEVIPSDKQFNYRNKITLHYNNGGLGYMKKNSNEIIEIDSCPLAMREINDYIKTLKTKKQDIIIRESSNKEIISTLDKKQMIETIGEFKFWVDINSFFQVNHYICSKIFEIIDNNVNEYDTCLDLYSGVGTLSIVASKHARFVYSIEVNEHSHKNALKNLELNKVSNVEFMLGKVENEITKIHDKIDVIITDPPRSGMNATTIKTIKEFSPSKIIYISCDPMTLARDLKLLDNYHLEKVSILDMFPNTKHVECACVLNRR